MVPENDKALLELPQLFIDLYPNTGIATMVVTVQIVFHYIILNKASLKCALDCVHFPGLSRSGSASWALHKSTDSVEPMFCAFPRSEQLRGPGAW